MHHYPRVENPVTHDIVNLYSDEINHWLEQGLKEGDIQHWRRVTPSIYNRETVFFDDVLYQIMLNATIDDIQNICVTDTKAKSLCDSTQFWNDKIVHDGYLSLYPHPAKIDYITIEYITKKAKKLYIDTAPFVKNMRFLDIPYKYLINFLPDDIITTINAKEGDYIRIQTGLDYMKIIKFPDIIPYRFNLQKSELVDIIVRAIYYGVIPMLLNY